HRIHAGRAGDEQAAEERDGEREQEVLADQHRHAGVVGEERALRRGGRRRRADYGDRERSGRRDRDDGGDGGDERRRRDRDDGGDGSDERRRRRRARRGDGARGRGRGRRRGQ